MERHQCACCGAPLKKTGEIYICDYCGSEFEDDYEEKAAATISGVMDELKEEKLANARRLLYDAVHVLHPSTSKVHTYATQVLALYPDDALARFYEASIDEDPGVLNEMLISMQVSSAEAEEVVRWCLPSLNKRNITALQDFVDRHFEGRKLVDTKTKLEREAAYLDEGLYNPALPRDIFLCYSSKDQVEVMRILDLLEENGFTVFCAFRNLRHGLGSAASYKDNLYTAMDHCKMVVFISSKNSRSPDCDAVTVELDYINTHRKDMGKIEYVIEDYKGAKLPLVVANLLKETFDGLEWCRTPRDLVKRAFEIKKSKIGSDLKEEKPEEKAVTAADLQKFMEQMMKQQNNAAAAAARPQPAPAPRPVAPAPRPAPVRSAPAPKYKGSVTDSKAAMFFICLFTGVFGIHRFISGKIGTGVLYLFTYGFFGIGVLIDLIKILTDNFD